MSPISLVNPGTLIPPEIGIRVTILYWFYATCLLIFNTRLKVFLERLVLFFQDKFFSLSLGIILVSAFWSEVPFITLRTAVNLLILVLFAVNIGAKYRAAALFSVIKIGGTIAILLNIFYEIFYPVGFDSNVPKEGWKGAMGHPNAFGMYASLHLALWYMELFQNSKPIRKVVAILGITVSAISVYYSNSSTAMSTSIVLILFISTMKFVKSIPLKTFLISANFLVISCILFVVYLANTFLVFALNLMGRDLTFTGRTNFWPIIIQKILDKPFLGYGYSGFWQTVDGSPPVIVPGGNFIPMSAHSGYLDLALQIGIIGFILVMASVLLNFSRNIKFVLIDRAGFENLYPSVIILFFLISNLAASNFLSIDYTSFYYVICIQQIAISHRQSKAENRNNKSYHMFYSSNFGKY